MPNFFILPEVNETLNSAHYEYPVALGWYYPWGGCYNVLCRQDNWSRRGILDLKDARSAVGQENAITMVAPMLADLLADGIVLVTAPSSAAGKISGITMLAQRIASLKHTVIDGTSCLVRTVSVPKAATGGSRSIEIHRDTIAVTENGVDIVRGKLVLLLDDVLTTGHTFQACKEKLLEAGAATVCCLALGRTYSGNPSVIPPAEVYLRDYLQTHHEILRHNYELVQPRIAVASHSTEAKHSP